MTTLNEANITSLSHEGRGIAHINGKTIFIDNALTGETVRFVVQKKRKSFDEGQAVEILEASKQRITPICQHYGICGGCQLQHLDTTAQQVFKQNAFLEQLKKFANTEPEALLTPLTGPTQHYRRRARLGVKYVIKKERVLVGFREKEGRYLADLQRCETLEKPFSELIQPLQTLFNGLKIGRHIPQVEIAMGDTHAAIVIRHLQTIEPDEQAQLLDFAEQYNLWLYLQPKGLDSIHRIFPSDSDDTSLEYRLEEEAISLSFDPWDFVQINRVINQKMVSQACRLLELEKSDIVLELFSGLGNFSLAISKQCQQVVGIEGSHALTQRARLNAQRNQIENCLFYTADLFQPLNRLLEKQEFCLSSRRIEGEKRSVLGVHEPRRQGFDAEIGQEAQFCKESNQEHWVNQVYSKLLIDPPRSGALEIMQYLPQWKPERIVYISCNPATLARDTHALKEQGYCLKQAGLLDMFPHTHHSEWMCLFIRKT